MTDTMQRWNRTVDISAILRDWDTNENVSALSRAMSSIIRDEIIAPLENRIVAADNATKEDTLLDELYKWEDMEDYFKITAESGDHKETVYHMEELYELGDTYGVWFDVNKNR